jgi:hypothetical protein
LGYRPSSFEKEFLSAPIHSPLSDCQSGPSVVGGVEHLFLASFSSCSFEMAEGFSRDFLPAVRGVEILFSASFFHC